jgi:hypothetical protein
MSQENVEIVRAFVEAAGRDPKHGQRYLAAAPLDSLAQT